MMAQNKDALSFSFQLIGSQILVHEECALGIV